MYKLVAIDLDGTLLDSTKEISARNKKAIASAIEKGVKIVICSGRVYSGARLYAKQIGSKDPIIACNGAVITEKIDGRIIYSNYLHTEACLRINDIFHKHDLYFHVYAGDTMYTEKLAFTSLKYFEKNKTLPEEDRVDIEVVKDMAAKLKSISGKVLKFVAVSDNRELLKIARYEIEQLKDVDVMSSNYDNFEVLQKGVNKGDALKRLSEYLNIPPSEMIAIGDNENDISMFKYAGLSVAMENGEDFAKEAAQYVTASNNDDGVALAIERFILNK
ncbi:HAD family phosphatase [Ruminiclostridium herbifermentans]|uniref:HAD family phosphatase n=1 Tax=Ruminiclostridium herbifermentans TaxID=2488810 RepID=A0A4U7JAP2_9FIRM|nr:Cof-type HAD-IIB family hydrolase [Ruminiclostridium herbifermentans]QNU65913.1 HAD family phosphatase [Ruminiclostridium herbifermentans]